MSDATNRRQFLAISAAAGLSTALPSQAAEAATTPGGNGGKGVGTEKKTCSSFLTEPGDFVDVSRGNPKPFTLKGEALSKARLTPQRGGWRSSATDRPGWLGPTAWRTVRRLTSPGSWKWENRTASST